MQELVKENTLAVFATDESASVQVNADPYPLNLLRSALSRMRHGPCDPYQNRERDSEARARVLTHLRLRNTTRLRKSFRLVRQYLRSNTATLTNITCEHRVASSLDT